MSNTPSQINPGSAGLLKATGLALLAASAVLVFAVLPAEYGIDPTGVGKQLGLNALSGDNESVQPEAVVPSKVPADSDLAQRALAAFGKVSVGQSFDAEAFAAITPNRPIRTESLELTLDPGKGAEVKMRMMLSSIQN